MTQAGSLRNKNGHFSIWRVPNFFLDPRDFFLGGRVPSIEKLNRLRSAAGLFLFACLIVAFTGSSGEPLATTKTAADGSTYQELSPHAPGVTSLYSRLFAVLGTVIIVPVVGIGLVLWTRPGARFATLRQLVWPVVALVSAVGVFLAPVGVIAVIVTSSPLDRSVGQQVANGAVSTGPLATVTWPGDTSHQPCPIGPSSCSALVKLTRSAGCGLEPTVSTAVVLHQTITCRPDPTFTRPATPAAKRLPSKEQLFPSPPAQATETTPSLPLSAVRVAARQTGSGRLQLGAPSSQTSGCGGAVIGRSRPLVSSSRRRRNSSCSGSGFDGPTPLMVSRIHCRYCHTGSAMEARNSGWTKFPELSTSK